MGDPQSARQILHAALPHRQLLQQGEVDAGPAELLLEDLAWVVEERAAPVEDRLADRGAQRVAARQLGQVHRHPTGDGEALDPVLHTVLAKKGAGVRKGQRLGRQRRQPPAQRALLAEQAPHLGDVGAAEDELQPRAVALLLDRRLDAAEHLPPGPLSSRQQIRELVDDDKRPLARRQPV